MAASNVTIEVQEYLERHKINALFEDIRAKLVKNLPSDPVNYLINVLKAIQEKKKRAPLSRDSSSTSRVEVTGKSVRPATADRLTKSADNVRPQTTGTPKKSPLQSSSVTTQPGSKPRAPSTPTTPKVSSSTSKDTPRPSKDTPRPSSKTIPRTSKPVTTTTKSSAIRPSTAPIAAQAKTTHSMKSATSKVASKSTGSMMTTPSRPTGRPTKRAPKPTSSATVVKVSEETIDEFFGEKKKSSSKQLFVSEQEEMAESDVVSDEPVAKDMETISSEASEDTTLIDAYLQKKKGGNKPTREDHLNSLQSILTEQKSDRGDRDSDKDSDEGEEAISLYEDVEVLQDDEGVGAIKSKDIHAKQVAKKQTTANIGHQGVTICARCARTMVMGDMAAVTADDDFESASQVTTNRSNFPLWDASTTVTEQSTDGGQGQSDQDNDSTVVSVATTAVSKDEWAGLTHPHRPAPISDSESEVQPPKVQLSGKSWTPPPMHESDDPSTTQQWTT